MIKSIIFDFDGVIAESLHVKTEAFANIYVNASRTIAAKIAGHDLGTFDSDFPTVQDGAIGVHFIHKAVESGKARAWINASYTPPQ